VIPRGNAAGKLDGAWQVVPCSQGFRSARIQTVSSCSRAQSPNSNLAPKLENKTKLIGYIQGLSEECPKKKLKRVLLRGVNSMDKPNGRLVLVSFTHYCAFTPSLSTRWSFWALQGDLILERASRLYAFSGYHNRTSLPSRALGRTTGTQEVRPSRSSRTKDSPPQISYAHSR
jgi:hypothetical protein